MIRFLKIYWKVPVLKLSLTNHTKYKIFSFLILPWFFPIYWTKSSRYFLDSCLLSVWIDCCLFCNLLLTNICSFRIIERIKFEFVIAEKIVASHWTVKNSHSSLHSWTLMTGWFHSIHEMTDSHLSLGFYTEKLLGNYARVHSSSQRRLILGCCPHL